MTRDQRTVLLVDNSASALFYWGMLLKRLEYKVLTRRSAEEALKAIESAPPAVVMTGIDLPGMDGVSFLRAMKEEPRYRDIPVIVLSSRPDPGLKETCLRLGAAAWYGENEDPDTVYRTIQGLTEAAPRRHIRLTASLKVIVGDGTVAGGAERTEYASALSEGGLYIRTRYPQPRNALTPVRIVLDGGVEVRARAVVLYSYAQNEGPYGEAGMGVKFVEISDQDRLRIRAFIKDRLTRDIAK